MGAPYAFSLVPGANINAALASDPFLNVSNTGAANALQGYSYSGRGVRGGSFNNNGVYAESNGTGLAGAAMYAKSTNDDGIALWAHNDSPDSSDAALVVSNDDIEGIEGDLIKGFGGDGGEDEFTLRNDGTIMTKADSSIFFPGTALVPTEYDNPRWENLRTGAVKVFGSGIGREAAFIAFSIPAVLYGQSVELEKVTIYYQCENGSQNYIDATEITSPLYVDPYLKNIYIDSTVRNSETHSYYSFDVNYTLTNPSASPEDILNLAIWFNFNNTTQWVTIHGVRITLGHHSLY
jgi:hypothetical protein